jgi:hypothetical protein
MKFDTRISRDMKKAFKYEFRSTVHCLRKNNINKIHTYIHILMARLKKKDVILIELVNITGEFSL